MTQMMYRELPHDPSVKLSVIGMGAACWEDSRQTEEAMRAALDAGVNFFDTVPSVAGGYEAARRVLAPVREQVYLQMHLGCDYRSGKYGWTRSLPAIKADFQRQLDVYGTDYTDFGFIHCIDEDSDFDQMMRGGLWDYAMGLKRAGVIRHLGCGTHNSAIARRFVETGEMDLMMFSINPMYDWTSESEYGRGSASERAELYKLCEREGVALSVMKCCAGGQLLSAAQSPFGVALTPEQCIQYALDKPAVVSVLPGAKNASEVRGWLHWLDATAAERDYSVLGGLEPAETRGRCVYCSHCHPCPSGLDIAMINKFYDLARIGDEQAAGHYDQLDLHASDCNQCGHCDNRCPFGVTQTARMQKISAYFGY